MGDILFGLGLLIPLMYGGITDYKHRIIPNGVCVAVFVTGLIGTVLLPSNSVFSVYLWQRAAGLLPAAFMLVLAYSKNGIGGGDIKLMAALGFAIGFYILVSVLFIATVTGIVWAIRQKKKSIPLGSFLCIGYFLVLIWQLYNNFGWV